MPQQSGPFVVATALGEERQLPACLRLKFGGKAEIERLRAGGLRTIGMAAALQEARKAEQVEAVNFRTAALFVREKHVDPGEERA